VFPTGMRVRFPPSAPDYNSNVLPNGRTFELYMTMCPRVDIIFLKL
jgi:hypothetical protein